MLRFKLAARLCFFVFCAVASFAPALAMSPGEARHLLARTGFGASPQEIAQFEKLSREAGIAAILEGVRSSPATSPPSWVNELPNVPPRGEMRKLPEAERKAKFQVIQRENRRSGQELKGWWAGEMVETPSPFTEHMVLFWHNHFTSSMQKVKQPVFLWRQNALFRREALGNFETLLRSIAKDPAMSVYLDGASNRAGEPNENFARELLELFTLGEGHYTENDIKAAARAFTGWGVERGTAVFAYRQRQHDGGQKTFMGRTGNLNGDDIVTTVLAQRQLATHIVEKLWREFVSPTPDVAEVARMAAQFRNDRYNMRPLMRALLSCPAFWAEENRGCLVKSPADMVVGTMRTFSIRVADPREIARAMKDQGQDLLDPPNVKGWPGGEAWIDSNSLLTRQRFVSNALTRIGEIKMAQTQGDMNGGDAGYQVASAANGAGNEMNAIRPRGGRGRDDVGMRSSIAAGGDAWVQWLRSEDMAALPQIQDVLLATAPVAEMDTQKLGKAIRALATDPVYQLK